MWQKKIAAHQGNTVPAPKPLIDINVGDAGVLKLNGLTYIVWGLGEEGLGTRRSTNMNPASATFCDRFGYMVDLLCFIEPNPL